MIRSSRIQGTLSGMRGSLAATSAGGYRRDSIEAIPQESADWLSSSVALVSMYGKTVTALEEEVCDMHRRLHLCAPGSGSKQRRLDRPTYTLVQPTAAVTSMLGRRTGTCSSFKSYRTAETEAVSADTSENECTNGRNSISESGARHILSRDISFLTWMESSLSDFGDDRNCDIGTDEVVDSTLLSKRTVATDIKDQVCEWGYFVDAVSDEDEPRVASLDRRKYRSFLRKELRACHRNK